eukprot:2965608-Prymnesium_polylepis.2
MHSTTSSARGGWRGAMSVPPKLSMLCYCARRSKYMRVAVPLQQGASVCRSLCVCGREDVPRASEFRRIMTVCARV